MALKAHLQDASDNALQSNIRHEKKKRIANPDKRAITALFYHACPPTLCHLYWLLCNKDVDKCFLFFPLTRSSLILRLLHPSLPSIHSGGGEDAVSRAN